MPTGANDTPDSVRVLQRKLYRAARQSRSRRFHALYDKVYRRDVLERAFDEVARNGGAAGVDGQTIDEIRQQGVDAFLSVLEAELREDAYRPLPVRRVAIPKASGGERTLGIPAVRDRVVQAAVKIAIEPIFEADFLDCSLGFRPKRSARQARERIRTHIQRERRHVVVDADIEGFFDNLERGILLRLLRERISDRRVLALIDRWLRAGVFADGALLHPDTGTPQGGVISPLLANVYLHALDRAWHGRHSPPSCPRSACASPSRRPGSSRWRWEARASTSSASTSAACEAGQAASRTSPAGPARRRSRRPNSGSASSPRSGGLACRRSWSCRTSTASCAGGAPTSATATRRSSCTRSTASSSGACHASSPGSTARRDTDAEWRNCSTPATGSGSSASPAPSATAPRMPSGERCRRAV